MGGNASRARRQGRPADATEKISLSDAARMLLDECRMVLPGVQALLGFQLIAVFNERFARDLEPYEQVLHFVSILGA